MRWAIDEARKLSPTWSDFVMQLRDRGFEFDRNEDGKYPKIKPKDGKQWTRMPEWMAYRNGNTRKGYWAIAGSGILTHTITNRILVHRGYYDISEAYKSLHYL